jgi:tetratricopeptide (TPR) repeat protein
MKGLSLLAGVVLLAVPLGYAQTPLPPGTESPDAQGHSSTPGQPGQPKGATVPPALAEVESKIQQQDFAGARPLVEKYLSLHPSDARGTFDLGYLEQAAQHDDAAVEDYRKAIAEDPKQFEARLALGLILAQQNKPAEAREQIQQATLLAPSTPNPAAQAQAFRALAALDRTQDPEVAREELLSALRLSPETPQDLLLTAQIAEANNDSETAEAAYRRLLAQQPQSEIASEATSGLVHLLLQQQKYADAESLLKSALGRDPDDPSLNAQLATTLIAEKKNPEALPVLEKLRVLEPKNPAVDRMLADAYSQAGQPEKADPIYAEMAQSQPEDEEVLAGQGENLIREHLYPQAQAVFARAVKLKPEDGDAWGGLAFAASQNGNYPAALEALSMRAKYLPETPVSYFLRATSYDNLHQVKAAEEYYKKFLEDAGGKFPDQEWQAKQRLSLLSRGH